MELSSLISIGQQRCVEFLVKANDVVCGAIAPFAADRSTAEFDRLRSRLVNALRPILRIILKLCLRGIDGPYKDYVILGLRLWFGASLFRHGLTAVFLLLRLIRKNVTSVLSLGTGTTRSVSRRETWRLTVPVREVGFMPLYVAQFGLYQAELVGQLLLSGGLLLNCLTTGESQNIALVILTRTARSLLTLGPLRMALAYPVEIFIVLPLAYGISRYRSLTSLSKAKVTVINTVNNYAGGQIQKAPAAWDPLLVAHLALQVTGLPWCAGKFLVYRNSILENGFWPTYDVLRNEVRSWRKGEPWPKALLRVAFVTLTAPLAFTAAILAGTFRPALAPVINFLPSRPLDPAPAVAPPELPAVPKMILQRVGLGAEPPGPPKNAMVEIYRLPHDIGLELFAQKQTVLIGGVDLPEIAVVTDPRLLVKMPLKPVTNNTFAFDVLYCLGDTPLRRAIEHLTKVPANPFRNHVEIQKFVTRHLDLRLDTITRHGVSLRQFFLGGLGVAYGLRPGARVALRPFTAQADMMEYLNAETRKHHPGWTTRAFGGQTKGDAWGYSAPRAEKLFAQVYNGEVAALKSHVWLALGVVKKQATRKKNDEEYRSRMAVIPEQELQLIWTHLMKPLSHFLEEGQGSWAPKFELFHGKLQRVWLKFAMLRNVAFVNEDMVDHGASLEWEIAEVIAQFYGNLVTIDGSSSTEMFLALFDEMVHAAVGLPDTDGHVHVLRTSRGMKDGVWGTSCIGGTYKMIGELFKIYTAWTQNDALRAAYPDPLGLVNMLVEEVHGDNSLAAYPHQAVQFMSGTLPHVVKTLSQIGLTVKPEESLITDTLEVATCMSWRMSNVGNLTRPIIIGWKPTADVLKGLFLPERLTDFDKMGKATRSYIGQIIVSLYILGYWNGEVRVFLENTWRLLWAGCDEEMVQVHDTGDFLYKTGLVASTIDPISSNSLFPYDPIKVVTLWLGVPNDRVVNMTAPGAPTIADGARLCAPIMRLQESVRFELSERRATLEAEDYDNEGSEGAGAFGRARPPAGGLPGGAWDVPDPRSFYDFWSWDPRTLRERLTTRLLLFLGDLLQKVLARLPWTMLRERLNYLVDEIRQWLLRGLPWVPLFRRLQWWWFVVHTRFMWRTRIPRFVETGLSAVGVAGEVVALDPAIDIARTFGPYLLGLNFVTLTLRRMADKDREREDKRIQWRNILLSSVWGASLAIFWLTRKEWGPRDARVWMTFTGASNALVLLSGALQK